MKKIKFSSIEGNDSLIDDIHIDDDDFQGRPILFSNPEIRKMLRIANVNEDDIFFDLGCGWGQNLILALSEFNVKRAIGFENNLERNTIACKRLERLERIGIDKSRYQVRNEDFEDLLKDKIKDLKLNEATVVFYGLSTSKGFFNKINRRLKNGCRLICYYTCLFPEIMPDKAKIDFPFYVYTFPFKKTSSEEAWLSRIIQKNESIFHTGKKPSIDEMWEEMKHDYSVEDDYTKIDDYKDRLKKQKLIARTSLIRK